MRVMIEGGRGKKTNGEEEEGGRDIREIKGKRRGKKREGEEEENEVKEGECNERRKSLQRCRK